MTEVLAAAAPDSPGDFAFLLVIGVVVCLLHFVRRKRSIRNDRVRRQQKIHRLMQESAAFADRWPGQRVAEAPYDELAAEHVRSNRLLALLTHDRIATSTTDHRDVDGQIAAVQRWLSTLPARYPDPAALHQPQSPPIAAPNTPAAPMHSATASVPPSNGFPLGEPLLHFRGIPGADDIVCSVESVAYRQLAIIKPRGPAPWTWRDPTVDMHFEVLRPDGAPLLYLTLLRGLSQRLDMYDTSGYPIARLEQTGSKWRVARTQRIAFEMQSQGRRLGTTQVRQRSWSPDGEDPVLDAAGQTIAMVEPVRRDPSDYRRPSFDFTLHCVEPRPFPVPHLLLVIGFSHYVYSRSWR